jgi:hypothetical protein
MRARALARLAKELIPARARGRAGEIRRVLIELAMSKAEAAEAAKRRAAWQDRAQARSDARLYARAAALDPSLPPPPRVRPLGGKAGKLRRGPPTSP